MQPKHRMRLRSKKFSTFLVILLLTERAGIDTVHEGDSPRLVIGVHDIRFFGFVEDDGVVVLLMIILGYDSALVSISSRRLRPYSLSAASPS